MRLLVAVVFALLCGLALADNSGSVAGSNGAVSLSIVNPSTSTGNVDVAFPSANVDVTGNAVRVDNAAGQMINFGPSTVGGFITIRYSATVTSNCPGTNWMGQGWTAKLGIRRVDTDTLFDGFATANGLTGAYVSGSTGFPTSIFNGDTPVNGRFAISGTLDKGPAGDAGVNDCFMQVSNVRAVYNMDNAAKKRDVTQARDCVTVCAREIDFSPVLEDTLFAWHSAGPANVTVGSCTYLCK
jgi:hypothetical protein